MSTITDTHRRIEVSEVRDILITSIVQNEAGDYVRSIRILGTPTANSQHTEIVELVLKSESRADLEIDAPSQIF